MTSTPKKHVLWQINDTPFSNLNSPYFDDTTETEISSTSTLEYVNAQLIAHGFAPSPGLCLDGVSNHNSARVVKCLLGLLGQRMGDMSRTEDLTTKCRTLTYDLERMCSLHRNETEKSANAEREMNLYKSKLAASLKSVQALENTQKQTTAELQRTRTLLQGIRSTHQAELRKKEKEIERILDKWQKVADSQSKVSAVQSGMRCANVAVVEGAQFVGRGLGFLDVALQQAEQVRNHLSDENLFLRKLFLKIVNELQSLQYKVECTQSGGCVVEEPSTLTLTTLFTPSPPSAVSDKVESIIGSLGQALSSLSEQATTAPVTQQPTLRASEGEIERLQGVISKLKEDLATSQKQALTHMKETQIMFDKFATDHCHAAAEIGEMSVELMTAPLRDEEKERLEKLRQELDLERQQFTEAAVKLGKEKAALEAERFQLFEERRSWEVEKMLSDLPATPGSSSPHKAAFQMPSPRKSPHKSSHKSPRKSPAKAVIVGKAGRSKAHRGSRSSLTSSVKAISYETELIPPPVFPPLKPFSSSSLLPTSFVLPPPSPRASLPTQPALPPALSGPPFKHDTQQPPPKVEVLPPLDPTIESLSTPAPTRRPFPVAKPFAQRMVHAYSPAKPSPLSRILMLADSPVTPPKDIPHADTSISPTSGPIEGNSQDSLERAVLGIPPPSRTVPNMGFSPEETDSGSIPLQAHGGRIPDADTKKTKASETTQRTRMSVFVEKENRNSARQKVFSKPNLGGNPKKVSPASGVVAKAPSKPTLKSVKIISAVQKEKAGVKPSIPGGGPRRVPVNSVDAPPTGKVWKG